jgi:hypothetical protein
VLGNIANQSTSQSANDQKKQVASLQASLDGAHDQILKLQPYTQDLTADQAKQMYDDLVFAVDNWGSRLLRPLVKDPSKTEELGETIRNCFKPELDLQLQRACDFLVAEEDIISIVVLGILQVKIFETTLPGNESASKTLEMAEYSINEVVNNPKRDKCSIRNWRAETFNAIIQHPDIQRQQANYANNLTAQLEGRFRLFFDMHQPLAQDSLRNALRKNIIGPSLKLHNRFQVSTIQYHFDSAQYLEPEDSAQLIPKTSPKLVNDLLSYRAECFDLPQNRSQFELREMNPRPTEEELRRDLTAVLTTVPGLYVRVFGPGQTGNDEGHEQVVRPKQVLVAWGSRKDKEKFAEKEELTALCKLLRLSS